VLHDPLVAGAYAIAVVVTLLMLRHVARVWPNAPARVPLHLGIDGRPGMLAPRPFLWLAPGIVTAVVVYLGVTLATMPPYAASPLGLALVYVIVAEVAAFVGWLAGLQVQIGRNQTFRIAPTRLLIAIGPIILTILALVSVYATP
jgi:hypothetical protein